MAGFKFHSLTQGAGAPSIGTFIMKDTETLTRGDFVNLESGEVDLAATGDSALVGIVLETVAGTDSTTEVTVIRDPNAVYSVVDANAREAGATLDIAGTTGAQTVASSSNKEFVVWAKSSATEPTLVIVNSDASAFRKAS